MKREAPRASSYREWAPPPALAEAVACAWTHDGRASGEAAEQRVLPDNCADILLELSPEGEVLDASVVGTMTRALVVPGGTGPRLLGIRFRPGWLPALLGIPGRALRDARVPAAELGRVPWVAPRRAAPTDLLRLVGRLVEERRTPPAAVRAAVDTMERAAGTVRIGPLCRDLGVSRQHLARLFDESVGIPPKLVGRVVRMQHVVAAAPRVLPGGWARLALERGYADQSHLVSDLRELTGTTPTGLA